MEPDFPAQSHRQGSLGECAPETIGLYHGFSRERRMGGPSYPPSGAPPPPSGWLPPAHHRPDMMSMAARWGRLIGLLLLFVGTLVVVWISSVQSGCLATPSTCANDAQNSANAIIA